jgi:hypothetical protein
VNRPDDRHPSPLERSQRAEQSLGANERPDRSERARVRIAGRDVLQPVQMDDIQRTVSPTDPLGWPGRQLGMLNSPIDQRPFQEGEVRVRLIGRWRDEGDPHRV